MRWSPARLATAVALLAWAGLFWFLLLTDRSALYLSSRTDWVVPVGAIVLTIAGIGRLATARGPGAEPVGRGQAWGLGVIVLPVVAILVLPPASLGSFAASRRQVVGGGLAASGEIGEEVSLQEVAGAQWSDEARRALFDRAGSPVDFTGIVTNRSGLPPDEFYLTRFIVSCCVADALSVQVRVVGAPTGLEEDAWVRVKGTIYPLKDDVVVAAASVAGVERPERPYLTV
jgi:uncharacterized repeat protein (TIGR03943 family)